jgi:hypothetical protein
MIIKVGDPTDCVTAVEMLMLLLKVAVWCVIKLKAMLFIYYSDSSVQL